MKTSTNLKGIVKLFLAFAFLLLLQACEEIDPDDCPACPKITSISPNHGRGGEIINISGINFEDFIPSVDKVTINGKEAAVINTPTATNIEVQVPENAGSGPVMITIGELNSEVNERTNFEYDYVKIDEIVPNHGRKGDVITINGSFFSTVPTENIVRISGVVAEVIAAAESQLQVIVPSKLDNGPVTVTINDFTTEGPIFSYDLVTIEAIEPSTARRGEVIKISGRFFGKTIEENVVTFPNGEPGEIINATEEFLEVQVPIAAESGPLSVIVDDHVVTTPEFTYEYTVIITTLAGSGEQGLADLKGKEAQFYTPTDVVVDQQNNVFVTDRSNARIRKITPDGQVSTWAGSNSGNYDGTGSEAQFMLPYGIAIAEGGSFIIGDAGNHLIRRLAGQTASTIAGVKDGFYGAIDGPVAEARFRFCGGVAVGPEGIIAVGDLFNGRIRLIKDGVVSTLLTDIGWADDLAFSPDGDIYFPSKDNHVIYKLTTEGVLTTFAGSGTPGHLNGVGTQAQLLNPLGIVFDKDGNIFFTEKEGHRVRKITPDGTVSDYAGTGEPGFTDGGPGEGRLNKPAGLAIDKDGNIYVVETGNNAVRKIILE
ncbi:IPT/TIG domain-containing protein [Fulvivirgaceae bacterium BMA12]|uniref:IPT/TIG domain-containing protein n=1 Tax=Agaribacillus aureus TaxID=3051825 RepID=A0ABT8LJ55_9BACT|nr:IPT/TIG domain-containing protein [Fulvivirgaceae bacterium BMA12]